jgi:hypothetical protein
LLNSLEGACDSFESLQVEAAGARIKGGNKGLQIQLGASEYTAKCFLNVLPLLSSSFSLSSMRDMKGAACLGPT